MTGVVQARKHFLTFERTATDSESHYIPLIFTLPCCHQRCSLDCDRMQTTQSLYYDHDATQSECAHRLFPLLCLEQKHWKWMSEVTMSCEGVGTSERLLSYSFDKFFKLTVENDYRRLALDCCTSATFTCLLPSSYRS